MWWIRISSLTFAPQNKCAPPYLWASINVTLTTGIRMFILFSLLAMSFIIVCQMNTIVDSPIYVLFHFHSSVRVWKSWWYGLDYNNKYIKQCRLHMLGFLSGNKSLWQDVAFSYSFLSIKGKWPKFWGGCLQCTLQIKKGT